MINNAGHIIYKEINIKNIMHNIVDAHSFPTHDT